MDFIIGIYSIIKIARNGESCIISFNTEYEAIKAVNELAPHLNDGNNIDLVVMEYVIQNDTIIKARNCYRRHVG